MGFAGNTDPKKTNGFTLLELLVVVAIIAVLLAILIPAIADAKRRARIVKCQSNLRQIGAAIHMYLNENDGYFPATEERDCSVYGGKKGVFNFWAQREDPPAEERKLWPYIDNVEVYHCPEDVIERPALQVGTWGIGPSSYFKYSGNSYGLNCSDINQ